MLTIAGRTAESAPRILLPLVARSALESSGREGIGSRRAEDVRFFNLVVPQLIVVFISAGP